MKEELILKNYKLMSVCAPHTEIDHNDIEVNGGLRILLISIRLNSTGGV